MLLLLTNIVGIHKQGFAQADVIFSETRLENHFPEELTFRTTATSQDDEIVAARLYLGIGIDSSEERINLEINPGDQVDLSYSWATADITIPPSALIFITWEVIDSVGNRARSTEELVRYDDVRYDWHFLENSQVAVWWHNRPATFGQDIFDIARQSMVSQLSLFGEAPSYQIRIIIYNDEDEFGAWHSYVSEFVGGEAFPTLGVTTQIVPDFEFQDEWLNEVIPHEISHLFIYQVSHHPLVNVPAWLNEGIAQYNENTDHTDVLTFAREAILEGKLIPLTALTGSFGYDDSEVYLAYAESISAVTYLIETYGKEGITALLVAYRSGKADQAAFQLALDIEVEDFQQGWLEWLNVPQGLYGTATPFPTLNWKITPPTMMLPPTPKTRLTMTSQASIQESPTISNSQVEVTGTPITQTPEATSPTPLSADATSEQGQRFLCLPTAVIPLLMIALIVWHDHAIVSRPRFP